MSASKFYHLSTLLPRTTPTPKLLSLLLLSKPFPSQSLRFIRCSSSAVLQAVADGSSEAPPQNLVHHPWPEWVTFVDGLKTKGYFMEYPPKDGDKDEEDSANAAASVSVREYSEMNVLKNACLSFARDRYDILKLLSIEDIKVVVKAGCPNLFRKAVNSAKRLRAYVQLDEGDVCSSCNLRGSCDKAYVILKETEAASRTVDIVRMLLLYALDPLVISAGAKPPGRESIDSSARKLLSQLTEFSGKSPDVTLPKHDVKPPRKKEKVNNSMDNDVFQNAELKRGDWMCPECNFLNFSKNLRCLKCSEDGPKRVGTDDVEMRKGDWTCSGCNFVNFSRNIRCLKCKAEGPKRVVPNEVELKKGDWNCTQCGFMNFASNRKCLRCRDDRPKRELKPGEWDCPSCGYLNYKKNMGCLKCNGGRPKVEIRAEEDDHAWKRPPRMEVWRKNSNPN